MSIIDISIIIIYLIVIVLIGLHFQKKASKGIDSYFLGDNKIPWWALGASGMSSNFDISGTMVNTALIYALGAVGFFIEIRGGIVLTMAFFMIFMGKWNRRAKVMTLAEWMELRFGNTLEGKIARLVTAIAILLSTVAIVTYFAVGGGKFVGEFLGIPAFWGFPSEFWASTIMIILAMIYTVTSGLQGVVWTDVFQGVVIFFAIIIVCFIALTQFSLPEEFMISLPLKDGGFMEIPKTSSEWTSIIPVWNFNIPEESTYAIYNLFGIAIIFYLIKTFIEGSGGTGGYMAQRFFAARSDREAGLLSFFWIFLLSFRWPFVVAITIMAISTASSSGQMITDPETVLPIVINKILPVGLKGIIIAGLVAAAMSTFDSLVNAGAAYWVKDVYQSFINPKATEKQLMKHSRWSTIIIVFIGLLLTLHVSAINEIWGWLTMSLGVGLIIPLVIRWYWWRLNGYGFAAGIAGGMLTALVQQFLFPGATEYISFLSVSGVSLLFTIIGTYLTEPTPKHVLLNFYKKTRPFGFWKPIASEMPENDMTAIKKENKRDIIAIILAIPWQLCLFLFSMTIIMKRWDYLIVLTVVLGALTYGLYHFWYKHLSTEVNPE